MIDEILYVTKNKKFIIIQKKFNFLFLIYNKKKRFNEIY
jgi:hypothetical protein